MKLGAFQVFVLSDGTFALDGGLIFGAVPKTMWERKVPADSRNRIRLGLNCLLVQTGKQNILIDTGIGDKFDTKFADIYGVDHSTTLPAEIRKHGLESSDIDIVINSHLHFDHCGWNARRDGNRIVPTFPNARYLVQRGEWEHALTPNERDRASYIEQHFHPAQMQTEFLDGNQEIVPGIRVEVLPGHTQHLQGVWIESEGERVLFISDLAPMRPHLAYPWIMSLDLYPMETLATKKRLLPLLVEQDAVVVFPHDAPVPWARLTDMSGRITERAEGSALVASDRQ